MKKRWEGNTVILKPRGYLTGSSKIDALRVRLRETLRDHQSHVIIDLSKVRHLNGRTLALLFAYHADFREQNRTIHLCCIDKKIENIYVITELSQIFDVFPNQTEALKDIDPSHSA